MIPEEATYLHACVKSFRSLKLRQVIDFAKIEFPEFLDAIPVFENFVFHLKCKRKTRLWWKSIGVTTLGDLFDRNSNLPYTNAQFAQIARDAHPGRNAAFYARKGREGASFVSQIPNDALNVLTSPRAPFREGEIVLFESDAEGPAYGKISPAKQEIQTLNVDESGFFQAVGTPNDTSQWDQRDWDGYVDHTTNPPQTFTAVQRVAVWNPRSDPPLIRGVPSPLPDPTQPSRETPLTAAQVYPLTEGWSIRGSHNTMSMRHMGIKTITKTLQEMNQKPPACESTWNSIFNRQFQWQGKDGIWQRCGTAFTTEKDEKQHLLNLHRKTSHRGNDSRSKSNRCRLGCRVRESHCHLETCPKTKAPRRLVREFLRAMGVKKKELAPWTWTTNMKRSLFPLPPSACAIIRIWRRMNYKHLTSFECSHIPYNPDRVCKDIARTFMTRILAYQLHRRNYYYDKRNTPWPCHRSHTEVLNAKPLGKLVYHSGKLKIKKKIKAIFVRYGVWTDFNAKFKPG